MVGGSKAGVVLLLPRIRRAPHPFLLFLALSLFSLFLSLSSVSLSNQSSNSLRYFLLAASRSASASSGPGIALSRSPEPPTSRFFVESSVSFASSGEKRRPFTAPDGRARARGTSLPNELGLNAMGTLRVAPFPFAAPAWVVAREEEDSAL